MSTLLPRVVNPNPWNELSEFIPASSSTGEVTSVARLIWTLHVVADNP